MSLLSWVVMSKIRFLNRSLWSDCQISRGENHSQDIESFTKRSIAKTKLARKPNIPRFKRSAVDSLPRIIPEMVSPATLAGSDILSVCGEDISTHPVETIVGDLARGIVLLCDHASNEVPDDLNSLGLPPEQFERHIGYDIGAAEVTRELARRLGAPAVLTRFSRLVIDPNRGRDDPTLVMRLSDGAVVPGNASIDDEGVAERIRRFYDPYDAHVRDDRRSFGDRRRPGGCIGPQLHAGLAWLAATLASGAFMGWRRPDGLGTSRCAGERWRA